MVKCPSGCIETSEGDEIRDRIQHWFNTPQFADLEKKVIDIRKNEREAGQKNANASDVAKSPPPIFDFCRIKTGIPKNKLWDICPYDPEFDSVNKFNAKLRKWSPEMNFFNYAWSEGKEFCELITYNFLKEEQSFVGILLQSAAESDYFRETCAPFAKVYPYQETAFGGFNRKLNRTLAIVVMV